MAVSRITYAKLFAVIGTTYGEGDGSTTFNIPNLSGRVPVGIWGKHGFGDTGGEETHVLTANEMPSHRHSSYGLGVHGNYLSTSQSYGYAAMRGVNRNNHYGTTEYTSYTGGSAAHNNMQPYLVVNYIIFAGI